MSLASLQELRERVRAATGPDRELDRKIIEALASMRERELGKDRGYDLFLARGGDAEAPEITSSIDAVLALVEMVLPGWYWSVWSKDPLAPKAAPAFACLAPPEARRDLPWTINAEVHEANGSTPLLAILDALLSVLITKEAARGSL